jgi:GntR family transcriptional regulator/MocR family aminotransferase
VLARVEQPPGGMQLPVWLQDGNDDQRVAALAGRFGLSISALTAYYQEAAPRPGLLLGYAGVPDEEVTPALTLLARCMSEDVAA